MSLKQAFFKVCQDAKPARGSYVSLYVDEPYYGGPEEGGWWGRDLVLVAYYKADTGDHAEVLLAEVKDLAEELSRQARDTFNQGCRAEVEWLEARGLDPDFLPEVDGEKSYMVYLEDTPGEHAYQGSRHYE